MDVGTRGSDLDVPVLREGADTPNGTPHKCPFAPKGADMVFCEGITTNYQQNIRACCGTQDSRAFEPCNFKNRRCHLCLLEAKGARASKVVDIKLGLCQEHVEAWQKKLQQKPEHVQPARASRHAIAIPAAKPAAAPAPRPAPKAEPKLQFKTVAVRPYEPQAKARVATSATEVEARRDMVKLAQAKLDTGASKPPVKEEEPPVKEEVTVVTVPAGSVLTELVEPPTPEERVPEFDVDACVVRYRAMTAHNKSVIGMLLRGEVVPGWGPNSIKTKRSELLTVIGVPKANKGSRFDRLELVRKVVARSEELKEEPPSPSRTVTLPALIPEKVLSEDETKECAAKIFDLEPRGRQILETVLQYGKKAAAQRLQVEVSTVGSQFSVMCTRIGLPTNGLSFNREKALPQVWAAFVELEASKKPELQPDSTPGQIAEYDREGAVKKYAASSPRNKELIGYFVEGRDDIPGLSKQSIPSAFSGLCLKLGLPYAERPQRLGMLQEVVGAYNALPHPVAIECQTDEERQLLALYRQMPKDEQDNILGYMHALLKKD